VRPPRPFQSTEPHVSHDATDAKICRHYNVGKFPWDDQCKFSHCLLSPWVQRGTPCQEVPQVPLVSSTELTHTDNMLTLSVDP